MGDKTPEPVEIQCPGCGTRFRLTPKKGRLPTGDIPCPKCYEEIPVRDGEVLSDSEESDGETSGSSAPKFGVMNRVRRKESGAKSEEDEAIERLEQMARDLPQDNKSTMAGLPGVGANPFAASRDADKTAAVDPSILEKVAVAKPADDLDEESSTSFTDGDDPDTSPRLVNEDTLRRLAQENSEAAVAPEDVPDDDNLRPAGLRRQATTAKHRVDRDAMRETAENTSVSAEMIRETAENKSITPEMVAKSKATSSDEEASDSPADGKKSNKESPDDGAATQPKLPKSNVLARIKKHQVAKRVPQTDKDESSETGSGDDKNPPRERTSPALSLDKLRRKSGLGDGDSKAGDDDESSKTLSSLFDKVKKKRGTDTGRIRRKLMEVSQAREAKEEESQSPDDELQDTLGGELSESELADIVDQSASLHAADDSDAKTDEAAPKKPALPDLPKSKKAPTSEPAPSDQADDDEATDHSGLFDDIASMAPDPDAGSAEIGEVSTKEGTTSQSMLARLKSKSRRHRGDNLAPLTVGAAGERRGSGYIRLPTAEIQDVLGQGDFRLKIEGVVYEPVDKEGLIQLIKGGVLLGAEQIAEADGDWMPASEHPVFGELRRKMAAEAHDVLSRIGTQARQDEKSRREADDTAKSPESLSRDASPAPPLPTSKSNRNTPSKSRDDEIPPEPATMELSQNETAALVSGMTDKFAAVGAEQDSSESVDEEAKTRESFEAIPIPDAGDDDADADASADEALEGREFEDEDFEEDFGDDDFADDFAGDDFSEPDFVNEEPPPISSPPAEPAAAPEASAMSPPEAEPAPADDEDYDDEAITAAQDTLYGVQQRKKRAPKVILVGLLGVLVAAGAAMMLTAPGQGVVEDVTGWNPADLLAAEEQVDDSEQEERDNTVDPAVGEAIAEAAAAVDAAVPRDDFSDQAKADQWVAQRLEDQAYEEAAEVMVAQWEEGRQDTEFLAELAGVLVEVGDFSGARKAALQGITIEPDDTALIDAHQRAIEADASLATYDYIELAPDMEITARGTYDRAGHQGYIFESPQLGDELFVFKPERAQWSGDWRVEVAAWRLCELIACHFEIFRVEPAILERAVLEEMAGETDGFAQLTEQVSWQVMDMDGEDVEAVRGSLEFVPRDELAPFPIEYRPLWRPWLTAGSPADALEQPIADHLDRIQGLADGALYTALEAPLAQVSTDAIARDVSTLLLFDFLTNNWERFSTREENYGLNNPVYQGGLVSRHNSEAFQSRASRRVRGRFEWTTRFSRSTVATIRALERERIFEVLFPEASPSDRRLELMWSQRQELLDRVDELRARHGEADVLRFP